MTAISLYTSTDAAYAVTDAGQFDREGRVVGFSPKTIVLPVIPMTISVSGYWNPERLTGLIGRAIMLPYAASALAALPGVLRSYLDCDEARSNWASDSTAFFIASYDRVSGRPGTHMVSARQFDTLPDLVPFEVYEVDGGVCMPGDDTIAGMRLEHMQDDPWRILCAQRGSPNPLIEGRFAASGWGEMFTVTAAGIIGECLGRFAEKVGDMVDLSMPGVQEANPKLTEWACSGPPLAA